MSDKTTIKPLGIALGAAFAAALSGGAVAADNPFVQTELSGSYTLAAAPEGKCGAKMMQEGKCGATMKEGKCGAMMGKGRGPGKFDADGDGKVTLEEFNAGHAKMFEMMDTDGDGVLSGDEIDCPRMGPRSRGGAATDDKPAEGAAE